jgi:hypothetical protein
MSITPPCGFARFLGDFFGNIAKVRTADTLVLP